VANSEYYRTKRTSTVTLVTWYRNQPPTDSKQYQKGEAVKSERQGTQAERSSFPRDYWLDAAKKKITIPAIDRIIPVAEGQRIVER
jgi:hypothetical protein